MKRRTRIFVIVTAALIALAAVIFATTTPRGIDDKAAMLEPSSASVAPVNPPAPARPVFAKNKSGAVETVIPAVPEAGGVDGQPKFLQTDLGSTVSPLCFDQLIGIDGPAAPVDVMLCDKNSGYDNIRTAPATDMLRTSYDLPATEDMPAEKGLSGYNFLGSIPAGHVIETYNESGGNRSTSLILVSLSGDKLALVDSLVTGDRCNGALTDARVESGRLFYSINVTPGDFPALIWGDDEGFQPYQDLEASAMSCFAIADYADLQLSAVHLNPDALSRSREWTTQFAKQPCFNRQFRAALNGGKKNLSIAEFRIFMDGFVQACGRK